MFKNSTFAGVLTSIFILFLPFVFSRSLFYAGINAKYFFVLGFVYCIGIIFAYKLWKNEIEVSAFKKPIFYALLGVVGVNYLAMATSVYPGLSFWSQILRSSGVFFFTHIALLSVMLGSVLKKVDWVNLRKSVVVSSTLFSLLYYFGTQGLRVGGRLLGVDFSLNGMNLGNETFAGAYVVIGLLFTIIEVYRSESNKQKLLLYGLVVIQFFNPLLFNFKFWLGKVNPINTPFDLFGSAKASSVVAFGLIGYWVVYSLIQRIKNSNKKRIGNTVHAIFWISSIVILVSLLFTSGSVVQRKYIEVSSGARIIIWESAIEAIKERPVIGWGPETFQFAMQGYFDNRLNLDENLGEIWFDRAHNYFIDILVSTGFLGLLAVMILLGVSISTIYKAYKEKHISHAEYSFLIILIVAYILQLQTSFETITTYVLFALIIAYISSLSTEYTTKKSVSLNTGKIQKFASVIIMAGVLVGGVLLIKESQRQHALVEIFRTKNSEYEKRFALMELGLSRTTSFESIRVTSSSFMKGVVDRMSKGDIDQAFTSNALKELELYEKYYKAYLVNAPTDYHAQVNLVYLYSLKTFLGKNSIPEARELIDVCYTLSPGNILTYQLDALLYLYEGKINQAEIVANNAIEILPEIESSHEILSHILKQKKTFPEISFLPLEGL